ncbi:MAG: hypothetical protein GKR87_13595 [Kiritimatiellae bacterium]|nr:hypothetical protein [Kiritimatiellia bacterium]
MEKLKERNPEEYARVQQLRQDDLQAFREELRHRLDQRRFDAARHHDADFQERFKDLPPEMQERLENRFRDRPLKKSDGQYPEIKKLHQKTKQLSKDHRKTMDTDKREEIKAELKTTLEELFDMREAKRTKKLEALEKNIQHQKKNMEKRKGQRNEIIERRLQKLTDGDPLEW